MYFVILRLLDPEAVKTNGILPLVDILKGVTVGYVNFNRILVFEDESDDKVIFAPVYTGCSLAEDVFGATIAGCSDGPWYNWREIRLSRFVPTIYKYDFCRKTGLDSPFLDDQAIWIGENWRKELNLKNTDVFEIMRFIEPDPESACFVISETRHKIKNIHFV